MQRITGALGGRGLFGVELFIRGDDVLFSEVSPRPHDTGLVTLVSQNLSQFALHVRAILGLPVPALEQRGPSASAVVLVEGDGEGPSFEGVDAALAAAGSGLTRLSKQIEKALGIAQGALDEAVKYAREREQFGQPIASFQGIQFMIADAATQIEAARAQLALLRHAANAGPVAELRARDLRLTAAQAAAFLNDVAGLGLSAQDVAALETRL